MTDHQAGTPTTVDPTRIAKYRAWLSAAALFTGAIFGVLGFGSFAAGEGLAGDIEDGSGMRVIITFSLIGIALLGFSAATLYLAWRFRPSGE